ncbi:MAG: hypothetical protein KBA51_04260 [Kiritimatiellae bacterium]|nr:hypothetical protein [Kiritimatiellia bacterium]
MALAGWLCATQGVWADELPHRLGGGVYYWMTLENLDEEFDENGLSYFASYQYKPSLFGIQADLEVQPDRFEETAYAPQIYAVLGSGLYAAAGIGILYSDGEWADEPFYSFKAGLDFELTDSLHIDINANYRFNDTADLSDSDLNIDTDTVFLGAALRLAF